MNDCYSIVVGYFEHSLIPPRLPIKFTLNHRAKVATSGPELAIEVLEYPVHRESTPEVLGMDLERLVALLDRGRNEREHWCFSTTSPINHVFIPILTPEFYLIMKQYK